MEGGQDTVNLIRDSRREAQQRKGKEPSKGSVEACYRCGNVGHFGRDPNCPARGKTCKKCGGANHFAQQCKTKSPKPAKPRPSGKLTDTKKKVRYVQDVDEDEDGYAFIVKSVLQPGKIEVFIDGPEGGGGVRSHFPVLFYEKSHSHLGFFQNSHSHFKRSI